MGGTVISIVMNAMKRKKDNMSWKKDYELIERINNHLKHEKMFSGQDVDRFTLIFEALILLLKGGQ